MYFTLLLCTFFFRKYFEDEASRYQHSVIVMRAPTVDSLVRVPSPLIATLQKAVWVNLDDKAEVHEVVSSLWHAIRRSHYESPKSM